MKKLTYTSCITTCVITVLVIALIYYLVQVIMTKRMKLRYYPSEFNTQTSANQQYLSFPLHDRSNNKVVGMGYTQAFKYVKNDNSVDVVTNLMFKFDNGVVCTSIFYNNPAQAGSVIQKMSTYESSISSGTDTFSSGKGQVKLTVNADASRDVDISCLPW